MIFDKKVWWEILEWVIFFIVLGFRISGRNLLYVINCSIVLIIFFVFWYICFLFYGVILLKYVVIWLCFLVMMVWMEMRVVEWRKRCLKYVKIMLIFFIVRYRCIIFIFILFMKIKFNYNYKKNIDMIDNNIYIDWMVLFY